MPCRSLADCRLVRPDDPTIAQQVSALVGERIDEMLNEPDRGVREALLGLAFETTLTVGHLAELFVARPLFGLLAPAAAR